MARIRIDDAARATAAGLAWIALERLTSMDGAPTGLLALAGAATAFFMVWLDRYPGPQGPADFGCSGGDHGAAVLILFGDVQP